MIIIDEVDELASLRFELRCLARAAPRSTVIVLAGRRAPDVSGSTTGSTTSSPTSACTRSTFPRAVSCSAGTAVLVSANQNRIYVGPCGYTIDVQVRAQNADRVDVVVEGTARA